MQCLNHRLSSRPEGEILITRDQRRISRIRSKSYAAGPDKGRSFFQELAAKQLTVFKGLGFAGGYLSGVAKADVFFKILELAETFGVNDWRDFAKEIQYPQADEFYLFEEA